MTKYAGMTPEEIFTLEDGRVSGVRIVEDAVSTLERGESVVVPHEKLKYASARRSVNQVNAKYKQMYREQGFSDALRKYSTHGTEQGTEIVRLV